MNRDDGIPEVLGRLGKTLVAQNARVVDQDVDLAEGIDCRLEDILTAFDAGDVVVVRDSLTPRRLDLIHDQIGHRSTRARAIARATEIVDDDGRTFSGKRQCMLTSKSTTGAGHNGNLSIQQTHFALSEVLREQRTRVQSAPDSLVHRGIGTVAKRLRRPKGDLEGSARAIS